MSLVEVSEQHWATRLLAAMDYTKEFVGNFRQGHRLGKGSYGQVYWVRGDRDGKRWTSAVKIMESDADDKAVLAYWAQESHIWHTLCPHPNILQLHEVYYGTVKALQTVAMVNELVDKDLRAFIHRYVCVDLEDARIWTSDLRSGLGHMQTHHIAHRDIKPANCRLKHKPGAPLQLLVGDFGQAALLHPVGTLHGRNVTPTTHSLK